MGHLGHLDDSGRERAKRFGVTVPCTRRAFLQSASAGAHLFATAPSRAAQAPLRGGAGRQTFSVGFQIFGRGRYFPRKNLAAAAFCARHGARVIVLGGTEARSKTPADIAAFCAAATALGRATFETHGVRPAVHPHMGALIESRDDIARVMNGTDPKVFFLAPVTGHLLAAGCDPVDVCWTCAFERARRGEPRRRAAARSPGRAPRAHRCRGAGRRVAGVVHAGLQPRADARAGVRDGRGRKRVGAAITCGWLGSVAISPGFGVIAHQRGSRVRTC